MLAEKTTYTVRDLFDNLDITLTQFSKDSGIDAETLRRIRDGKPAYSSTANKMLNHLSQVYARRLGMDNVEGINIQVSRRARTKK